MLHCGYTYRHAFWSEDGIVMTDELNNPNFSEIVDNIKNGLPYDSKHNDRTDTPGERRIGNWMLTRFTYTILCSM